MTTQSGIPFRSFQLHDFGESPVRVEHHTPHLKGGEILVRVKGAGVCHTDLHLQDGFYDLGSGDKLSFRERVTFPVTPGHEIAGEIVALGDAVSDLDVGTNVVVCAWIGCGECTLCRRGDDHLCGSPAFLGVNQNGGYSDYVVVPDSRYLVDIGEMDPVQAAPLACSGLTTYSAIRKFGDALEDEPLVILGAGGLGLMAVELVQRMGYAAPVVVEIDTRKREAALAAGAKAVIDPNVEGFAEQIKAAVGMPILSILDLVGSQNTFDLCLQLIQKGGRIVIVGLLGGDTRLQIPLIPMKAITIEGSYVGRPDDLQALVALLTATSIPDIPIHRRPLNTVATAMNELRSGSVVGRIVLIP